MVRTCHRALPLTRLERWSLLDTHSLSIANAYHSFSQMSARDPASSGNSPSLDLESEWAPKPPEINAPEPVTNRPPSSTSREGGNVSKAPADVDVKPPAAGVDATPPAADTAQLPAKPQLRSIKGGGPTTPRRQGHLTDVSSETGVEVGEQAEFEQAANEDVEQQPLQKAAGDPATENVQPSMQRQGTGAQSSAGGKGGRSGPVKPVRSGTTQKTQAPAPTRPGTARSPALRSRAPLNTVPEPYPNLPRGPLAGQRH